MPAMPHMTGRSDAVRPQRLSFVAGMLQTRQRRANTLQGLSVAPLQDARETSLALATPQALIFDQPTECACKPLDVPSFRRIAVDVVTNEIGHTSHFAGDYDRKAGAHGFVHGKPPGFVLRGQHEYV